MSSRRTILNVLVLFAVAVSTAIVARADTDNFTLTGQGNTVTFSLPSSPTPYAVGSDDFVLDNVSVIVNGVGQTDGLDFYTPADGGGLEFADGDYNLYGLPVFSGSLSDPTFTLGDYALDLGSSTSGIAYNLDITNATAPEPSSILLLATGVLALLGGFSIKRFARENNYLP
jgi:hypothetical protein